MKVSSGIGRDAPPPSRRAEVFDVLRDHNAEGVGFEPTMTVTSHSGFQARMVFVRRRPGRAVRVGDVRFRLRRPSGVCAEEREVPWRLLANEFLRGLLNVSLVDAAKRFYVASRDLAASPHASFTAGWSNTHRAAGPARCAAAARRLTGILRSQRTAASARSAPSPPRRDSGNRSQAGRR
jgi:hypothetical protein